MITSKNNNINILLYHQIGDAPESKTNLDCFCSSKEFYLQMEFLKNSAYQVISLNEALDKIFKRKVIDKNYVVLTFDDGCEKFYDITFPVLDKFNFPSTIYPIAGFLGKYAIINGHKYSGLKILSTNMLFELSKLGVEIGAHTMAHDKLTLLNKQDAFKQVKESKKILEQIIGKNITSFAYPHGAYNHDTIEIIKELEFNNALTCINDCAESAQSIFEIPRKYITYFDNLELFKQKLN